MIYVLLSTCLLFHVSCQTAETSPPAQSSDAQSSSSGFQSTSDPMNGWEEPQPAPEEDWVPEPLQNSEEYEGEIVTRERIAVIGVPLEYGQERDGVQNGPDWIRRELFKAMDRAGCWYDDYGDTEVEASDALDTMDEREDCGKAKFAYTDALAIGMVENAVSEILTEGSFGRSRVRHSRGNELMTSGRQSRTRKDRSTIRRSRSKRWSKIERSRSEIIEDKEEDNYVDEEEEDSVSTPAFPLTLGGDHSLAMGTLEASGKRYPDLAVIYIDAHGDINTINSTVTGHIHGMPLSFVIKDTQFQEENSNCPPFSFIKPVINPANIAFIGTRDLDPPEVEFIRRLNISTFTPSVVKELGPQEVVKQIFDRINPDRTRPVHVSFDIDSIDPLWAPSTGTAVPNGLTLTEAVEIAHEIARTKTMIAIDVVEVNPKIKRNRAKLTVKTAVEVIMAFLSEICERID